MTDPDALTEAAREELNDLWHDLMRDIREAINGQWSMACDGTVHRIKRLTPLVGPTPWDTVPIPLLESGLYQRIHAELGIDAPVDMERVAKTRERINRRSLR